MNQTTIANTSTLFQLKRILTTLLALIACLFGLVFVPGFLAASLIDALVPLRAGPLWGYTLLVSTLLLGLCWWYSRRSFQRGLIRYALGSAALLLVLVIVSLFASGQIFYGYSLQKMFEVSEADFVQIEQERGRLKPPAPEPTLTDSTATTTTEEEEAPTEPTMAVDACEALDNSRFIGMSGIYYLRLFNKQGNTYEFTGKVEARDVNGKLRKNGDKFTILSGNVTGEFTLLNNCQELTGHFQDDYGSDISFDYARQ
jgi:hypothetical protein